MTCNPFTVFLSLVSQTISWFHHSYAKLCYTRSYLTDTLSPFGVWRNMRKAGNPDLRFLPWCLQNWIKIIHSGQWNVPPSIAIVSTPTIAFSSSYLALLQMSTVWKTADVWGYKSIPPSFLSGYAKYEVCCLGVHDLNCIITVSDKVNSTVAN